MASQVNQYKIWCITEDKYVYGWGTDLPTTCPIDTSHTIDPDKTVRNDVVKETEVTIHGPTDEEERSFIRAESRDSHDTTYFATKGDKWVTVEMELLEENANGVQVAWQLPYMENKNINVYVNPPGSSSSSSSQLSPIDEDDYSVDLSQFDSVCNMAEHFSRGVLTFNEAPVDGSEIYVDYEYAEIMEGTELKYDQSVDGDSKDIIIRFCDPVHIKDGLVIFEGGTFDSTVSICAMCPQIGTYYDDRLTHYDIPGIGSIGKYHFYKDNNGDVQLNTGANMVISEYVKDHPLFGTCHRGIPFDVEARSSAFPPGYFLKLTINAGSATNLKAIARLEINRQRTAIN
jgi:hypothetical protein